MITKMPGRILDDLLRGSGKGSRLDNTFLSLLGHEASRWHDWSLSREGTPTFQWTIFLSFLSSSKYVLNVCEVL
jgi:hypothetical protein